MTSTMRAAMALVAALAAMAVGAPAASALPGDCGQLGCVLLIEVDGLEPGDVTPAGTPFLWALAHPNQQGVSTLLPDRNGFMWQAGRSPMQAGTAPSTASLLTGANPDEHGVLDDEYMEPTLDLDRPLQARRLRPVQDQGGGDARPIEGTGTAQTLLELVATHPTMSNALVASFIGNPALDDMLDADLRAYAEMRWAPDVRSGGDPSLCPPPRRVTTSGSETTTDTPDMVERDCPARDGVTLREAFSTLSGQTRTPLLTYVHLAELGRVKQLDGEPEAVNTVTETDAALSAFIAGLSRHPNTSGGFGRTVVMVTGNHGYEPTPLEQRVPHPGDDGKPFAQFVTESSTSGRAQFVPQGTIGTVYYPGATAEELAALQAALGGACDCIDEVVPTATLAELHDSWFLNPLTSEGLPTGTAGDLLVTTKPGWAFGEVEPATSEDTESEGATNPNLASAGGPRNRAIAVIMNGPRTLDRTVKQVSGDWMGVSGSVQSPPDCRSGSVSDANDPARTGDDVNAPGHECQPETVDIPLSIAGLLNLSLGGQQAPQARFLNEAFTKPLGAEEPEPVEEDEIPVAEPPPDPPPVVIRTGSVQVIPPPPFVDPFPYRGLVRRIRVRVTDAFGRGFKRAKRGARMSSIEVRAHFGKSQSLVTLTFYRRRGKGVRRLKALARFKPFVVKRGPVKLKLKIPRQFRPSHLGLSVQEVEGEGRIKRPVGRPGGGIAKISGAKRLHRVKRATRKRATRKRATRKQATRKQATRRRARR